MRPSLVIVLVMGLVGALTASVPGDDLRHPDARKAVARAQQQMARAEMEYKRAMIGIQRTLISELERAKSD